MNNSLCDVAYRMQLYASKTLLYALYEFCLIFMSYYIVKQYHTSNECNITGVLFLSRIDKCKYDRPIDFIQVQ